MHRQFGNIELNPPPQVLKLKSRASQPPSGKVCITFPKTTAGSPAHRSSDGGSRFQISTCLLHLPPCLKFFPVAPKLVQGVVTPTKCYRSALALSLSCQLQGSKSEDRTFFFGNTFHTGTSKHMSPSPSPGQRLKLRGPEGPPASVPPATQNFESACSISNNLRPREVSECRRIDRICQHLSFPHFETVDASLLPVAL